MGNNYDGKKRHRHYAGPAANRTSVTPHHGELIMTTDTPSPKLWAQGDTPIPGGYLVGPMGAFFGSEKVSTDIGVLVTIPWGATTEKTDEFSHSVSVNSDEIEVLESGGYAATCILGVLFTVGCYVEASIQRYNGSSWSNISGGRGRVDGAAGEYKQLPIKLTQPMVAGWKFRVLTINSNLTTGQVACVQNFCSFEIKRYR